MFQVVVGRKKRLYWLIFIISIGNYGFCDQVGQKGKFDERNSRKTAIVQHTMVIIIFHGLEHLMFPRSLEPICQND